MNPGVYPVPPGYPTKALGGRQVLAYCPTSRTVRAPFDGLLRVRALGASSSGACASSTPSGSNGATVAFRTVKVRKNDLITVVIGAGGLRSTGAGLSGGTTTATGPNGLNLSIPPSSPGITTAGQPAANPIPTGADEYWLGGLGGSGSSGFGGGGGSPALLEGTNAGFNGGNGVSQPGGGAGVGGNGSAGGGSAGAGGGSGGPAVGTLAGPNLAGQSTSSAALTSETHSRVLVNVSGGATGPGGGSQGSNSPGTNVPGGFGGGGGGGGTSGSILAGAGGRGAGGGGVSDSGGSQSGPGGDGFITLEFQEEV